VKQAPESLLALLVRVGVLTPEQAAEILPRWETYRKNAARAGRRREEARSPGEAERPEPDFFEYVASLRLRSAKDPRRTVGERELYQGLALGLDLPYQRIDPLKLDLDVVTRMPRPFALRHVMVPLALEGDVLTIATADPFDEEGLESVTRTSGFRVRQVIAARSEVLKIITEFYGFKSSVVKAEAGMSPAVGALSSLEQYVRLKSVKEMEATDQHIVNAVDFLFTYAFDQHASDIHLEPKRDRARIRFRIDGVLHTIHQVTPVIHPAMVSRIKMLSRLDIAERRRPQDGRIRSRTRGGTSRSASRPCRRPSARRS
jgi:general secretion pathway protein E